VHDDGTGGPIGHLYVHVPFCPTICPFCSFHVLRRRDDLVAVYLDRLDAELADLARRWPERGALHTVYLGGGTPSQLTDGELERLLGSIRRRFDVTADAEIGIEVHPLDVGPGRPRRWAELGFRRVSVGVQSTQDPVLRTLGRPHDAATALRAVDDVLAAGLPTVNADLIVAVPGQDVAADLDRLAATGVTHLAAYTLTIEDGTPFARRGVAVDEAAEAAALRLAGEVLSARGLHRYEVSNHARPGHECAHNLGYWRGRCWFGVGPSATALLPGPDGSRLLARNPTFDDWVAGAPPDVEGLDPLELARTRLLTGLRLAEGLDEAALWALCPSAAVDPTVVDHFDGLRARIDALCGTGRLWRAGGRLGAHQSELVVLDRLLAALW
jgi:oxygen-independent coproporphyrinogen-3 oxidase